MDYPEHPYGYGRANKRDKDKISRYGLRVKEFVDSKNKEISNKLEEIKKEVKKKYNEDNL